MDGVLNQTRYAMKRYKEKNKTEKKKIQLSKKNVKKERNKETKITSKHKRIEEDIKQHAFIKKRELKNTKYKKKYLEKKGIEQYETIQKQKIVRKEWGR